MYIIFLGQYKLAKKLQFIYNSFMRKLILILLMLVVLIPCRLSAQEDVDEDAPSIILKTEEIIAKEGDVVDLNEYVEVSDDSDFRLISLAGSSIEDCGIHEVTLLAVDEYGNCSEAVIRIKVLSIEEYSDYEERLSFVWGNALIHNEALLELKGDGTTNAIYELALNFIGMRGSCFYVATKFMETYRGYSQSLLDTYDISVIDAQPGDIIYYADGGLGIEHWAVYLGGDLALHGNYLGKTIIGKVYVNRGSEPQFRRLNEVDQ